ncbi:MAG: hypothetical protein Q9220_006264 [cf. Caloplaca sp. 1 TL-2023]
MALTSKPSIALRSLLHRRPFILSAATRSFHSSPRLCGSPLLNLAGLSTSRECQFLSKERGIPRTEFSPHLELIKSSEVTPFKADQSTTTIAPMGDGPVIAYLTKEVENTKAALVKVKEAERVLRGKLQKTEREAMSIVVISLALVLHLLLYEEIKIWWEGLLDPLIADRRDRDADLASPQQSPKIHHQEIVMPQVPVQPPSPEVVDVEPSQNADPVIEKSQPRLAGLFWAS